MKVIFLDFDGVVNNRAWFRRDDYYRNPIDPAKAALLDEIVAKTGAKVVISSAWRADGIAACRKYLRQAGCNAWEQVIGTTGNHPFGRGEEIAVWLDGPGKTEHGGVTHYVILDDDAFDMGEQMHKLIHTDKEIGLTADHIPAILKHLED